MPSLYKRRVKIVSTLGPSSNTKEKLIPLITAGLDVARLNFSHGDHAFHKNSIQSVRDASKKVGKSVAIMQDLQGPKLRLGALEGGEITLKAGDIVLLYPEGATPKMSTKGRIPLPISAEIALPITKDAQKGSRILFDDGKVATRITQISAPEIVVEVEVGGRLTNHKGMNLPGTPLTISCLTDKDLADLKFGLSQGVDAVALSFVREGSDIESLRAKIRKASNYMPLIVSKVEREEAIENQASIIELSDVLLIARGDMAVEIGAERVPTVQKSLIAGCNELGVAVITATQMLESMILSPTPTRAEASDVANAVYDGTDAVMLSAETASGKYPVESVSVMASIIIEAETAGAQYSRRIPVTPIPGSIVDSIEKSAAAMASNVDAKVIACLTHSGMAARTLAKFRPLQPIVALMDNEAMARKLAFVWGVQSALIPEIVGTDDLFAMVEKVLRAEQWADKGDLVVVTAGIPTLRRGTTNMVKIHKIGAVGTRSL